VSRVLLRSFVNVLFWVLSTSYLDEVEFERWLRSALRTLESAKRDLEFGDYNWACFKAHQVAENLPRNPIERLDLVEDCVKSHSRVEPVLITLEELNKLKNKNPAVIEVFTRGLVLVDDLKLTSQHNQR
jgi:hypothetical protein